MPLAGRHITPNLKLVEPLGSGGMGSVWVGEHLKLGTRVAVKMLQPRAEAQNSAIARFEREASLAATLTSPHAVRIYDYGFNDGAPYIVMELLEGITLADRIKRDGALPPANAAVVVKQLCAVLGQAHDLGIVHRDVKPHNVFLLDSEYDVFVKLLDFGIAKPIDGNEVSEVTETGAVVGTPHYASPEQLLGAKRVDHRSDLWSLGVLAYHALSGRRPFEGDTMAALSIAICNGDFTPISKIAEAPRALDTFFGKALCVASEDRFDSAAELGRAFEDAMLALDVRTESLRLKTPAKAPAGSHAERDDIPSRSTLTAASAVLSARRAPATWRWVAAAMIVAAAAVVAVNIEPHEAVTARGGALQLTIPAPPKPDPPPRAPPSPEPEPQALQEPPAAKPKPRPAATRPPRPKRASKPSYCATDAGYTRNARGHLVPKPECL